MLYELLPVHRHRIRQLAARLMFCTILTVAGMVTPAPPAGSAEPAESLRTGIVPTMGLNDVTEGMLLFRTNQSSRFRPAPVLKTDVQIAVTGTIARATVRQEFTNPSKKKATGWKASMCSRCRRPPRWTICA